MSGLKLECYREGEGDTVASCILSPQTAAKRRITGDINRFRGSALVLDEATLKNFSKKAPEHLLSTTGSARRGRVTLSMLPPLGAAIVHTGQATSLTKFSGLWLIFFGVALMVAVVVSSLLIFRSMWKRTKIEFRGYASICEIEHNNTGPVDYGPPQRACLMACLEHVVPPLLRGGATQACLEAGGSLIGAQRQSMKSSRFSWLLLMFLVALLPVSTVTCSLLPRFASERGKPIDISNHKCPIAALLPESMSDSLILSFV